MAKNTLHIDGSYHCSLDGEYLPNSFEADVIEVIRTNFIKESDEVQQQIIELVLAFFHSKDKLSSETRKQLIRKMKRSHDPEYELYLYQPSLEELYKQIHSLCKHTGILNIKSTIRSI